MAIADFSDFTSNNSISTLIKSSGDRLMSDFFAWICKKNVGTKLVSTEGSY